MVFDLHQILRQQGYLFTACKSERLTVLYKYNPSGKTCIIYLNNHVQPTLFSKKSLQPLCRTAKKYVHDIQEENILFLIEDSAKHINNYKTKNMIVISYGGKDNLYENVSHHPAFTMVSHILHERVSDLKAEQQYMKTTLTKSGNHLPIGTILFIVINLLMLPLMNSASFSISRNTVMVNREYYRLISYMFIHCSFLHLFSNMLSLWYIGKIYEKAHGLLAFLFVYLLSGIFAGCATITLSSTNSYTAGASGAIFALIGATLLDSYRYRDYRSLKGLSIITLINILFGVASAHIDNICHIGGLFAGVMTGYIITTITDIFFQRKYICALKQMTKRGLPIRYIRRS